MTFVGFSGFAPEVASSLEKFIAKHKQSKGRKLALFDADGTLWHGDAGEAFIRWQVKHGNAPHAPKDAWEVYFNEATKGDAVKAYGWLAQWNAGVSEAELYRLSEEFFAQEWERNIFKPMQVLVSAFSAAGFECWVVSGSIHWVVAMGATRFGIPKERVIGTAVKVNKGVLTDVIDGVVPYRAGKSVMVEKIIKDQPLFAAGNTYWDKELVCTSRELGLAINSEHPGEPNYESEQKLQQLAKERQWLSQRF